MSRELDEIFEGYDRGQVSRRDLLAAVVSFVALGTGRAGAESPPAPALPPSPGRTHLNHVNLRVADVQRSLQFYHRFFGLEMTSTPTYNALDCGGGTFISLQTKADIDKETFRTSAGAVEWARTPAEAPGMIEHFCLEVDDFDLDATRAGLQEAGHETVEVYGNLLTADPDGVLVQIVDSELVFTHEGPEPPTDEG
jgi:catechol 2,3-dioxygenase-like lactoylglutathione lyase family enzyme